MILSPGHLDKSEHCTVPANMAPLRLPSEFCRRCSGAESRAWLTFEQDKASERDAAQKGVRVTFVSDGGRFPDVEFGEAAVSLLELLVYEEMDWLGWSR